MPSTDLLTPRRRDALVALVAVVLLAGPLWIPALHFDDPTYRFERATVTVNGSGLSFANASAVPAGTSLSEDVACVGPSSRACAFERHLSRNHTVLTGIYSTQPGEQTDPFAVGPDRYDYVQLDGVIYEPTTVANHSRVYVVANGTVYEKGTAPAGATTSGDVYRNELALRPASPAEALAAVSRGIDTVPDPIGTAARTGAATTHRPIDEPPTPIRTNEGSYYRVYLASQRQPLGDSMTEGLLVVGLTGLGLFGLYRLRDRIVVTYEDATETGTMRDDS